MHNACSVMKPDEFSVLWIWGLAPHYISTNNCVCPFALDFISLFNILEYHLNIWKLIWVDMYYNLWIILLTPSFLMSYRLTGAPERKGAYAVIKAADGIEWLCISHRDGCRTTAFSPKTLFGSQGRIIVLNYLICLSGWPEQVWKKKKENCENIYLTSEKIEV